MFDCAPLFNQQRGNTMYYTGKKHDGHFIFLIRGFSRFKWNGNGDKSYPSFFYFNWQLHFPSLIYNYSNNLHLKWNTSCWNNYTACRWLRWICTTREYGGVFRDFKHFLGYSAFPLTPPLILSTIPSEWRLPGALFSKASKTFRSRNAPFIKIWSTPPTELFILICLQGNKCITYRKVWCLKISLFTGYRVNYSAQNGHEKFWGFRETHACPFLRMRGIPGFLTMGRRGFSFIRAGRLKF